MFQQQADPTDAEVAPVSDTRDRNARQRGQYADRKGGDDCLRCSRPHTVDSPYCAEHLASEVERVRLAMRKLRADRKQSRICAWCPNRSGKQRLCKTCRRKRNRGVVTAPAPVVTQPTQSPWARDGERNQTRAITEADGRTRNRGVGRGKRGHPSRADRDTWCLRVLRSELELAAVAVSASHSPEVAAMPRIQRDAIVQDALSHLGLLERQLDELVDLLQRRLK